MFEQKNNNFKRAFTLSELLISLGIIGILTAILMPIFFSLAPDQNTLMAKRAFYTTETVISDLLNDPHCYPSIRASAGLDDGIGYNKCEQWGDDKSASAQNKLITLFTDKLDLKGAINGTTFTTKDGMKWTFSNFNFANADPNSYALLTVDVNGDKEPNCGQSDTSGACADNNRKSGFDRFTMIIYARGKVEIEDCWASLAARVDKKLVGKENADCSSQGSNAGGESSDDPTASGPGSTSSSPPSGDNTGDSDELP